jgi:hypothetical protein
MAIADEGEGIIPELANISVYSNLGALAKKYNSIAVTNGNRIFMPKYSFHVFCSSYKARIDFSLSIPGVNMLEKALLALRKSNLSTAQAAYLVKQKAALAKASQLTTP